MDRLQSLIENYRYGDYYIPDDRYETHLRCLRTEPLTQALVDYLCAKIDNHQGKCSSELRFIHLQIFFLNPSVRNFDLKEYLHSHIKRCRHLWLKLFFIRAFALYADESELIPIMRKFEDALRKSHDYKDYESILSAGGLPYLCSKYGYACFTQALRVAEEEYLQIDPLLRGFFTLDEAGDFVEILTPQQTKDRLNEFLRKKRLR